jgi:hypothetical protein
MVTESILRFLQEIFKTRNVVNIKVIKISTTNKNLNLTLRPYMVQKLIVCDVS